MKIGIFFGGQSREREVSFAGGRTVYDNLDKGLFQPVPIFVDSLGHFILLDWQYLYKGTIRDFYPPVSSLPPSPHGFQVYAESLGGLDDGAWARLIGQVGRQVHPHEFPRLFDFAFLALHGPYGEDGNIQGLLEWYGLPYSGSGILPSAIGIDKALQRELLRDLGFAVPNSRTLRRQDWRPEQAEAHLAELRRELGLPLVVKAAHQGSSIGVSILRDPDAESFAKAVERALFIETVPAARWASYSPSDKVRYLAELVDIRQGIGLPVALLAGGEAAQTCSHPEELLQALDAAAAAGRDVRLQALDGEEVVLFESFIEGKEFSCIVVEDENGRPLALPPTQIVKRGDLFDYRSKYLPGSTRKVTPIDVPAGQLDAIRKACERLYAQCHFDVYARLDGFITASGDIFLNDPNTTSGMMPSSFFFHQAAEIGLNPSQFLTYIIRTSLAARMRAGKKGLRLAGLLAALDADMARRRQAEGRKTRVAVLLGGYSSERHISVESGRNVYEKLASSEQYAPFPVFLTGREGAHELYALPINLLLKDNADDIREKVRQALSGPKHPALAAIVEEASGITARYAQGAIFEPEPLGYAQLAERADVAFIALHGRPGEDGAVQAELERVGLPYNGSNPASSSLTIDKFATNEVLRRHGISVAKHALVGKREWLQDPKAVLSELAETFGFPLIAKPSDDGCSSAVKKINSAEEFEAFATLMFREEESLLPGPARRLKLKDTEEFPQKQVILVEELIGPNGADHFLEVTGGLLTKMGDAGLEFEVFEPSEALATGEVLSLEEKFLAGEGQNITPARFDRDPAKRAALSAQVRATLEAAARALGIEGYTRIDAFVRIYGDRAETIIIEANSLPGMTPATCIFHQSALNGYTPLAFIDRILQFGLQRQAANA